ncbi:bifunctional 4-hydroxy-2-oxoglutarate aldolase/2-dehydro-3-deoxy-phosphogluconate aldolase [Baaleninema simplex]|uniref:bifunctional 4-hydroxy-2-oxoglutarate aldolase/2-dehydro-3-deoxy-phosphogluconate aldolase n=1 Tax=Baaleninema simplex TaxID=2862350 RepID=UPI00034D855F|nr:bifunctional 4-hydroxy-2-oxoglutarate aldolase/2-dehydro-3-deoxy-phosphogluconate aldolase [Baaleninema simplex]
MFGVRYPDWLDRLKQQRAIAVVRSPTLAMGYGMARAVVEAGMEFVEVGWNGDRPAELVRRLRDEFPHCQIGAGTLVNARQVREAIAARSQFLFCPHTDVEAVRIAIEAGVPMVPGALSPTEILTAWTAGAAAVKVFPVQAVGGASYIRSLKSPLDFVPFVPTGGVTLDNARSLVDAGAIAVGISSSLFPRSLVESEDWQGIAGLASRLRSNLGANG